MGDSNPLEARIGAETSRIGNSLAILALLIASTTFLNGMVDDLQRNRIDGLVSLGDAPSAATMASTSLLAPATRLLWAAFWAFLVAIPPLYRAQVELKNATDSDQVQAADLWAAVG
jgi:hypothetical protein